MLSFQVQTFGAPLGHAERATPTPEGGQVLLRVAAAGVCHTDLHVWHGGYDLGGGRTLSMAQRGVSLPLTLGHEIVGQAVAIGPEASSIALGRLYLVYPWIGCGQCKVCRRGAEHLCPSPRYLGIFRDGGYSDHVVVPDARYLVDVGDMPPERAAPYACSGLTVYSALRKIEKTVLAEERVVIIGAGGVGLMAVTLIAALGGAGAIVVEPNEDRRKAALSAGAINAVDPAASGFVDAVKAAAGGAVWAVLDCVGSAQTVQIGLDLLVKGGQLVQVGLFGGAFELPTAPMALRSISYQGSFVGSLPELRDLVALVRDKAPAAVPSCCRPLSDATAALADLEHGRVVGRVILQPD